MSDSTIPLSQPSITEAEIQAVTAVMRTDRLSIGPHTEAFEAACTACANRKHGVAVNSGTSGLHLLVRALDLKDGDEVITTPFSFVATTNCLLFERAKPVFVDIDADSYNMDPSLIAKAITKRTKAILPVEVFGNTAHFDAYEKLASKHKLAMIEDCCEALGGQLDGRPAGNFGDAGVFAFYPNKQITTGEGGMIVTDDERIRDVCRSLRNQGRDTVAWLKHARLGYNYRMSEISAVIGEVQVKRLGEILDHRRRSAAMYDRMLAGIEEIHLPTMKRDDASWFVYVIRLADKFNEHDRDAVMASLRRQGVSCNPYFVPIHTQPYVRELLGTKPGDFPVTERIASRTMALPFFAELTEDQAGRVHDALKKAIVEVGR